MKYTKSIRIFLTNFIKIIRSNDLFPLGGQITYYLVLSLLPLLLSVLNMLSYLSVSADFFTRITLLVPENFSDTVNGIIQDMVSQRNIAVISVSTLTTIWAASRGIEAVLRGLHRIYQIPHRSTVRMKILSLVFYFILIASLVLSFASGVLGDTIVKLLFQHFGYNHIVGVLWQNIRLLLSLLLLAAVFLMLNKLVTHKDYTLKQLIPGALFSAGGWIGLSFAFSIYVNSVNNYSIVYGGLAGMMLLLLWLYWAAEILLFGAAFNVALNGSYSPTELAPPKSYRNY
jgi:membrane protein